MQKGYIVIAVLLLPIIISFFACNFNTTLSFENRSEKYIDSVVFSINNSKIKITSIKSNEIKHEIIFANSIKLNSHDITVLAYIYVKDSIFRGASYYNDLSGSLNENYTLILNKDSTTKLFTK